MGAPRRRRRIRKLRLLALIAVLLVLASVAFTFGLVRAVASAIPQLDPALQRGDVDTLIYDSSSHPPRVLARLTGAESRTLVTSIDRISPIMRQAIVSIEDRRFYEHNGVDLRGIGRAVWQDMTRQKVIQGGSTITQQFVKNAYLGTKRSLGRKIREAALAWQLEQKWTKDRILLAYLNTIYFGNGAYGIQRAAQTYFGVGAAKLDLVQASLLAGIPADPTLYDPVTSPRAARARRHDVLTAMFEQGKITAAQRRRSDTAPLPRPEDVHPPGKEGPAPYFVNYVKSQLVQKYGTRRTFGGGLRVTTTIDLNLQELARKAVATILPNPDGPAAALVAIDPRDGSVRAMYGGTSFRKSQFNLATQAERQPGSSFKPIVLASAFHALGISPATAFDSKPFTIFIGDRSWHVTNYESEYAGRSDLASAMIRSDNAVYAQLTQLVGPRNVVKTAHALGIRGPLDPFFSIGLGQLAVNPLDMARAYATIANDGKRVDGALFGNRPRVVEKVEFTKCGCEKSNRPVPHAALTPGEAETLTSILERVVTSGTGTRAALPDRPVAGKTGTTDKYGDAWFVGYTPQLVTAVWVGYPNELRPMLTEFGGRPVAGGTLPALIWKEFMTAALKEQHDPPASFTPAPYLGYSARRIVHRDGAWKYDNGYCKGTRLVVFFSGRTPPKKADCKQNEVAVPSVVGRSAEDARAMLARQPLGAQLVYAPAPARTRPGVVIRQRPAGGGLSAGDNVTLVVTKARYGLVPDFVGSSLADAHLQVRKLRLRAKLVYGKGPAGQILRQSVRAGLAAWPGLRITLVVGR
jgi:penicillin-binding protein 1A